METFYGILVAVALAVVIMVFQSRKKKESWSGVVVDIKKKIITKEQDEGGFTEEEYVSVFYKTDNGKKGKIQLKKYHFDTLFPDLKIGDRLVKDAGEDYPKVV